VTRRPPECGRGRSSTQSTIGPHLAGIRSWLAPLVLIPIWERCHVERIVVPVVREDVIDL
jgi:hypothetical protein